jgi:hypothetical protein
MKMFIAITEFLIALVGFNTGGKVDISTDLLCDDKMFIHTWILFLIELTG